MDTEVNYSKSPNYKKELSHSNKKKTELRHPATKQGQINRLQNWSKSSSNKTELIKPQSYKIE